MEGESPSKLTPMRLRVGDLPPSQPTRYWARNRCSLGSPSAPATRAIAVTPVGVLDDVLDQVAEAHVDVGTGQALVQCLVDLGLDEAVLAVPAEFPGLRVVDHDDLAGAVDQSHDVLRGGVRQHGVHQAHGLDGAQGLVVKAHAARVVDEFVAWPRAP